MDYYTLINDLSSEKISELLNNDKIKWNGLINHLVHNKKIFFTKEQLDNTDFDKFLLENKYIFSYVLNNFKSNNPIYSYTQDYLNKNIKDFPYNDIGQDKFLLDSFLSIYPEKKTDLKDSISLTNINSFLWQNDSPTDIAQYINSGRLKPEFLAGVKHKLKTAPENTLIDEKHYISRYGENVEVLLKLFPRTIPFSFETAKAITENNRNLFLILPLKNQADFNLFNFATNNTIYGDGGWGSYDETDSENIPIKKISPVVLDYIKQDSDGVSVAVRFIDYNVKYLQHPNVQQLINTPKLSEYFWKYHKHLTKEQKKLAKIFDASSVPSILGDALHRQPNNTLIAFIPKAEHIYEMGQAFILLVKNKANLNELDKISTEKILDNFQEIIKNRYGLSTDELNSLAGFIVKNDPKNYANLQAISDLYSQNNDSYQFNQIVTKYLNVEEKLEYLEFLEVKEAKKNKYR